jgi:voltage-gated potassium channel
MPTLKSIIEKRDTRAGKLFDVFIQFLIVLSLVSFSIETLPDLKQSTISMLQALEVFSVTIFTIEYIARIFVASHKLKFIFSFYGLIDLFAIVPFYLTTGIDLRSLRAFRLLRLFRALKLVRYSSAIVRVKNATIIAKEEFVLFLSVSALLLYFSSVGIYYFENEAQPEVFTSIFTSLWWAVSTLTTVGYRDIYPITTGGRIFTFFILIIGLGLVSVPAGLISSALTKAREMENKS